MSGYLRAVITILFSRTSTLFLFPPNCFICLFLFPIYLFLPELTMLWIQSGPNTHWAKNMPPAAEKRCYRNRKLWKKHRNQLWNCWRDIPGEFWSIFIQTRIDFKLEQLNAIWCSQLLVDLDVGDDRPYWEIRRKSQSHIYNKWEKKTKKRLTILPLSACLVRLLMQLQMDMRERVTVYTGIRREEILEWEVMGTVLSLMSLKVQIEFIQWSHSGVLEIEVSTFISCISEKFLADSHAIK